MKRVFFFMTFISRIIWLIVCISIIIKGGQKAGKIHRDTLGESNYMVPRRFPPPSKGECIVFIIFTLNMIIMEILAVFYK
jgi:hypothetical protein